MMRRLYLLGILVFISAKSFSQQGATCAQTLRLARATYEQGRLHEIEGQLKSCLESGFTKEERREGYKILCLSYIYLEEPDKADGAMLNILRTDPYFQINEAVDPAEFVALYKTFRTRPIYRIGGKIGVNASRPNVVESATVVELAEGSEYKPLVAFQFGATADLPLSTTLTLHGDLLFQQKRFALDLIVDRGLDQNGEPLLNEFQGTESQAWLSLPITLEYKFLEKKINPYVGAGVSVDYLLGSSITSERSRKSQTSIEEKTYDFQPQRKPINISAVGTAGIKVRIAGGFFVAEARFIYGLTSINSKEDSYANSQYALEQGYADSVYKLTSLALTTSYVQNIFNPKKLKRKR
jgi:hypothetical protein